MSTSRPSDAEDPLSSIEASRPTGQASSRPAATRLWSVGALMQAVTDALGARFGRCTVRGEISGFTQAASGHCYFTLKDEDASATLRCAMFRRTAMSVGGKPENGWRVDVSGELSVYGPRGELQLVVEGLQRAGAGSLYEEFLRLKARLEAQGLFKPERKRPLAAHPETVGIVTSLQAAALHDVLTVFARRAPHVRLIVYPCAVQGSEAPAQICQAIAQASARCEVDTLIVCRGGGSMEDLWAFNNEAVVRAVAECRVPVISGVGHETDVTLTDFAADVRAPTPSAAAELATRAQVACLQDLEHLQQQLQRWTHRRLDTCAQQLDNAVMRLSRPQQVLARHAQRLALLRVRLNQAAPVLCRSRLEALQRLAQRLTWGWQHGATLRTHRLESLALRLGALDPHSVLRRGYAMLSDEQGRTVTSVRQLHARQVLRAQLADGSFTSEVQALAPDT